MGVVDFCNSGRYSTVCAVGDVIVGTTSPLDSTVAECRLFFDIAPVIVWTCVLWAHVIFSAVAFNSWQSVCGRSNPGLLFSTSVAVQGKVGQWSRDARAV